MSESVQVYSDLFRHLRCGIAVYDVVGDGEDFVFADYNPAAERITDTTRKEVLGRSVQDLFPGITDFGLFAVFQRVWHTGVPEIHPIRRYEDGRLEFWSRNHVFRSGDRRLIAIFEDMSGRVDNQDAALLQRQKLHSIATLAAGLAHEINNPLHIILTAAEMIQADLGDSLPQIAEHAGIIVDASNRASEIVSNLLAFSRQGRGTHVICQVGPVLTAAVSLIHATLRQDGIALHLDLAEDLPSIRCQPQHLQQALLNLIDNARDSILSNQDSERADGEIRVTAKTREEADGTWFRITIQDNGPGVPPEIQAQIFDPFFTTRAPHMNAGLGLSVAHGIIEDHRGTLSLRSLPGEPTRFFIDIPVR